MGRVIWEIILGSLSGNEDMEGSKVNKRHVNKWDTAGDTGVTPSFWEPFEKPYRTCSWGGHGETVYHSYKQTQKD